VNHKRQPFWHCQIGYCFATLMTVLTVHTACDLHMQHTTRKAIAVRQNKLPTKDWTRFQSLQAQHYVNVNSGLQHTYVCTMEKLSAHTRQYDTNISLNFEASHDFSKKKLVHIIMWLDLRKGGTWSRMRFCFHFEKQTMRGAQ
jgi:hypothetical protein